MGECRGRGRGGLAAAALLISAAAAEAACAPDKVDIRTSGGAATFQVEVVDTPETRAQGLMFRESMALDAGMLFVYPEPAQAAFWMKNTPLPLDIIFINARGMICNIAADTTPYSLDHIPSQCAAQTVLEVNAGQAEAQGLKVGAPVRHPAVKAPVWACE